MIDFLCLLCVELSVASFSNKIGEIELFLAENENSLDTKHMEVVLNLMKSLRGKLMQSRSTSDDGSHKIREAFNKRTVLLLTFGKNRGGGLERASSIKKPYLKYLKIA